MPFDIGDALGEGLDRATERNAAMLFAAFAAIALADAVVSQTILQNLVGEAVVLLREQGDLETARQLERLRTEQPLALGISTGQAAVLWVAAFVVGETVRVIADRTFVSDETAGLHEPGRDLLAATAHSVVASVVVAVVLLVGFALLVLPGVFAAVVFFFARQEIAVEGKNAVDALADSVALTGGHRLEVFSLAVALFVVEFAAAAVAGLFPSGLAAEVVSVVLTAAVGVFASAVAAQAYRQLRAERERAEPPADGGSGGEWDDPPGVDI